MPHAQTKTVFYFDELDDRAQERARDWFREGALDYDWWEFIYENAVTCGKILGIEIDTQTKNNRPTIYFSGFSSQGDGACFEGRYEYAKGASKAIRKHAPNALELHLIADELQSVQRKAFYNLCARMDHKGRYATSIDVTDYRTGWYPTLDMQERIAELMRDFMEWIYRSLEKEYEWQMADEQIDESILANEYEFNESGSRV